MNNKKFKTIFMTLIMLSLVLIHPKPVYAESFITTDVPFSYNTNTANYDFSKYTMVTIAASASTAYGQNCGMGNYSGVNSVGTVTFSVFKMNGEELFSKSVTSNQTISFDLSELDDYGYFYVTKKVSPQSTWIHGGAECNNSSSVSGSASASNLTLYSPSSPSISSTNLM